MSHVEHRRIGRFVASNGIFIRRFIVLAILLAEVGICFWQHLGNTRYFAWAPNDYAVTYGLRVDVDGRRLTKEEISHRYRLDLTDRLDETDRANLGLSEQEHYLWEDPPQRLIDRLKWYEQRHASANPARVTLIYQLDGNKKREWRWPR
jgi:hypothetical protein